MMATGLRSVLIGWGLILVLGAALWLIVSSPGRLLSTMQQDVAFETRKYEALSADWKAVSDKPADKTEPQLAPPLNGQSMLSDILKKEVGEFRELRQLPLNDASLPIQKWRVELEASPFALSSLLERLAFQENLFLDQFQVTARDKDRLFVGMSLVLLPQDPTAISKPQSFSFEDYRARNPFDPGRKPVLIPGTYAQKQVVPSVTLTLIGLKSSGKSWQASISDGSDNFPVSVKAADQIAGYTVESIDKTGVILASPDNETLELKAPFAE